MTGGSSSFGRALRITLLYLILGVVWIAFSDTLLEYLAPADSKTLTLYQTYKGWFFILITSGMLFLLIRESFMQQEEVMERLASSEARYRHLATLAPVGIYHADARGMITYVNTAVEELTGMDAGECLGTGWLDSVHEEDKDRILEKWEKCIAQEEELREEYRLRHRNGNIAWIIEIGHPEFDDNGELAGYLGILIDITRRREVEEKRRELEERLRLAVHTANVGFFDWDLHSGKVYYSREWKSQIGYEEHEIGDGFDEWRSRVHPDDVERVSKSYRAFLRGEQREYVTEFRFRHKDGSWRWILTRAAKINDENGSPVHMLGLHVDITDLKNTEQALRDSEARLNYLLSANPTVLYALEIRDKKLQATWISGNINRILGYDCGEAMAEGWWSENLHPEDRQRAVRDALDALDKDRFIGEYRFRHKDGSYIWIRDEMRVIHHTDGRIEIIGSWSDVSERRREEEKMRLYGVAFESSRDGVIITDPHTRIVSVNRAFTETLGYGEEELIDRTPRLFDSGRQDADFYEHLWEQLKGGGHWQGEFWVRKKSGEVSPQWLTINAVYDDQDDLTHYVAVYSDISKLKQSEEKLERMAHYDVLTSLPNRLLLDLRLDHAIQQTHRRGGYVAILFLDLDDFKKINDSLGHAFGDEVLITVAHRLETRVRAEDTLGRFGGDEFLVILENIERPDEAATVARDLLAVLRQPYQLSSGQEVYAEGSIGISLYPDDGSTHEELLRNADTAMYRAKKSGRNQFRFFTEEMSRSTVMELEVETALRQALEQQRLSLHYQPKVNLRSGRISGMEALLRWHDGNNFVEPSSFIPIAEKAGLIVPMGAWAINSACRQIREWLDAGLDPVAVAVNVSAAQFRPGNLEEFVRKALETHNLDGARLELEITESSLMEHPEDTIVMMQRLNDLGVSISLDDFGTGFSNLSYLTRFPIEIMKIDGSFIDGIETDDNARAIVASIIDLAHGMNMHCVAEKVETRQQVEYLLERGCDEMQGHYFCRAVPAADLMEILREGKTLYSV